MALIEDTILLSFGRFLRSQSFLILLFLALSCGFGFPGLVAPLAEARELQRAIIASVILVTSFPVGLDRWLGVATSPWGIGLAFATNAFVVPLLAWPLALGLGGNLGFGLLLTAIVPSTVASAAFLTQRARGNPVIPLLTTPLTNLASLITIPFWLGMTGGRGAPKMDQGKIIQDILWLIVVPMILAQALRFWPTIRLGLERNAKLMSVWAQIGILSIVLVGGYECRRGVQGLNPGSMEALTSESLVRLVLVVAGLHAVSWGIAYFVARRFRLGEMDAIGAAYAGSQKTLMVGLHLAIQLAGGVAIIPMVTYHALQLILGTLLADWFSRKRS